MVLLLLVVGLEKAVQVVVQCEVGGCGSRGRCLLAPRAHQRVCTQSTACITRWRPHPPVAPQPDQLLCVQPAPMTPAVLGSTPPCGSHTCDLPYAPPHPPPPHATHQGSPAPTPPLSALQACHSCTSASPAHACARTATLTHACLTVAASGAPAFPSIERCYRL